MEAKMVSLKLRASKIFCGWYDDVTDFHNQTLYEMFWKKDIIWLPISDSRYFGGSYGKHLISKNYNDTFRVVTVVIGDTLDIFLNR